MTEERYTRGNMQRDYIFFAGRRTAWRDASGKVYYYLVDATGSTRIVTDSSGNVCFDADYYPYGQENDYNTTCTPEYRFAGYEFDSETGNYYAYARYYNPRLGRFMSPDPLGGDIPNPQSLNRYTYVMNNPTNWMDPLGLKTCPPTVCGTVTTTIQVMSGPLPTDGIFDPFGNDDLTGLTGVGVGGPVTPGSIGPRGGGGGIGTRKQPRPQTPQSQTSKPPLLVCAAETANKLSLAQAFGTNGKSGFFNSLANGVLGNTFSTITEYAYGGSSTEFGTTAYDFGTKATENSINAVTGAAPITDLGLGAESASQIAEGVATEGLGGIFTVGKLVYDFGTFAYGVGHCY